VSVTSVPCSGTSPSVSCSRSLPAPSPAKKGVRHLCTPSDGKFVISGSIIAVYAISNGLVLAYGLWSLYKLDHPGAVPLQRGHGLSIPKGWQAFRDWDGQWKYKDKHGNIYDNSQNPWDVESQKGSLTENNFRSNLKKFTGESGLGKDAHHIFPQSDDFKDFFDEVGIDINNPKYGTWWDSSEHRSKSYEYNQEWSRFIRTNPNATKEEVLRFGQKLAAEYKLDTNF
jgi:hypothetical protein